MLLHDKFYGPNDSAQARIVVVTRNGKDDWRVKTLCEAPFVHRFGIFHRAGVNYLLVCCLKSGHSYDGDWRFPGACYAAELPADLSGFDDGNLLPLTLVQDNMLKNHGFSRAIWHLDNHNNYVPQWKYAAPEKETEMLHATWADTILGKPTWLVGWRQGTRCAIAISWDAEAGNYRAECFDTAAGMANAMHFVRSDGKDIVVGTNREIDELAYYVFTE